MEAQGVVAEAEGSEGVGAGGGVEADSESDCPAGACVGLAG